MEAPLRSRLVKRLRAAALAPLRVLVLAALVFALVLPASAYAASTSPAGTPAVPRAAGRGLASSALPAGLRAALARDLGRAQPAGVAGAAPTFLPLTQQQPLPDPRAAGGDTFGHSVALSGDGTTALVGATARRSGARPMRARPTCTPVPAAPGPSSRKSRPPCRGRRQLRLSRWR